MFDDRQGFNCIFQEIILVEMLTMLFVRLGGEIRIVLLRHMDGGDNLMSWFFGFKFLSKAFMLTLNKKSLYNINIRMLY